MEVQRLREITFILRNGHASFSVRLLVYVGLSRSSQELS